MKINNKLTTEAERKELRFVGIPHLKLRYLKDSRRKMGIGLWDVLEPRIPGYVYGPDTGLPTLSIDGLKERGLI